ncbi:hypothetical protein H8E07_13590 [bacterium]|nr:hypothetical protein [bacterium]
MHRTAAQHLIPEAIRGRSIPGRRRTRVPHALGAVLLPLLFCVAVSSPAQGIELDYSGFFHWQGKLTDGTPGSYVASAIDGDYVYLASSGRGLQVVSLADPSQPVLVGGYATADDAVGVAVAWPYVYVAASSAGLVILDATDPADPSLLGSLPLPDPALDVVIDGGLAFVAARSYGLVVVDVGTPTAPAVLDRVDTDGYASGLTLWDAYIVLADALNGVNIISRDPYEIVKAVDTPGTALSVDVASDHIFVADYDEGMVVIDAANIALAQVVGILPGTPPVMDVVVDGDTALLANHYAGLLLVDVSNPRIPVAVTRSVGQYDAFGLALDGGRICVAAGVQLHVFELGNALPAPIFHQYELNVPRAVAVGEHYIYAVDYARLNVLEPTTGARVGLGGPLYDPQDICLVGSHAYITEGGAGLRVADVSDPGDPELGVASYLGGQSRGLTPDGGHLYVAVSGLGIVVLDLAADPGAPVLTGFGSTPGEASDVVVQGDRAYVADGSQGLHVFDVTDPTAPATLGRLYTAHDIGYVDVEGNRAYGLDVDELVVYDVTDPADIQVLSTLALQGPLQGIEVSGGIAYVADPYVGLYVIDVSVPQSPAVIGGGIEGTYLVSGIALYKDKLYIVDQRGVYLMPLQGAATAVDGAPGSATPAVLRGVAVAPNPFNPRTTISFSLAAPTDVRAGVYDLRGGLVAVLADRRYPSGDHALYWGGRDGAGRPVSSGVYVLRLGAGGMARSEKMVLVR